MTGTPISTISSQMPMEKRKDI